MNYTSEYITEEPDAVVPHVRICVGAVQVTGRSTLTRLEKESYMINCTFELNNKAMSTFKCGATSFSAFSGLGKHVNSRLSACIPNQGPIPPGTYYIFDRQSGGLFGSLRDLFNDRDEWFALYAIDRKIDDATYCNEVKRGNFRLHPKGIRGISQGCITLDSKADYLFLRTILKKSKQEAVPGSELLAYGKVVVK